MVIYSHIQLITLTLISPDYTKKGLMKEVNLVMDGLLPDMQVSLTGCCSLLLQNVNRFMDLLA